MPKHLVIVESPAKAKTISKYLGKDYVIKASYGHVRDLPDRKLGVDLDNNFEPVYQPLKDKKKVLADLKTAAKNNSILIATDPDREGEAIAWHIQHALKWKDSEVRRVVFNEITPKAVKFAIENSRLIDKNLVDAQQARRILDRLIGYKLSPILSKKIRKGLSAGRVQSVAVKIICDRENEINAFVSKEYWVIEGRFEGQKTKKPFSAKLFAIENLQNKSDVTNEKDASAIVTALKKATAEVSEVKTSPQKRNPYPPFITSTLQQEASRKLNWTAKKTMLVAQQLYEGVEIKGEPVGLITYMRTDSVRISDDAKAAAKNVISSIFGTDYLGEGAKGKAKKNVQDAHEAIRPSYPDKLPASLKDSLTPDQAKLYKLIWDRFIASQMPPAQLNQTTVIVNANGSDQKVYLFKATGSVIVFDGFLKLYAEGSDNDEEEENAKLPALSEGEKCALHELTHVQKFTQPPARYTEATLVKILEEKGIGRPSTYAPTISVIQDRGYVTKDKKTLLPSELGMLVNTKLESYFDAIVDVDFTASMESKLDEVSHGKHEWQEVVRDFYTPFSALLKKADSEMEKVDTSRPSDEICDKCGSPMLIKAGRFGEFLACSNYPDCKNTKSIVISMDIPCPECKDGEIIEKRSKRGFVFYGCTKFPSCKYATWDQPLKQECPTCNAPIMFKKVNKKFKKETIYCAVCTPQTK